MADPISVASTTIASLNQATKAQETLPPAHDTSDDRKRSDLDIEFSLSMFKSWQEAWSGQAQRSAVTSSSEALWVRQGWADIGKRLNVVIAASKEVERCLIALQGNQKPPRLSWRSAARSLRAKKQPQSELRIHAAALSDAVCELWLYSGTVYESLHAVIAQDVPLPSGELLLNAALRSRAGSLQLYEYCAKSSLDCSLAMGLLDAGSDRLPSSSSFTPISQRGAPMHLFFQLFGRSPEDSMQYQKMVVELVTESRSVRRREGNNVLSDSSDIVLFEPMDHSVIIQVEGLGSGSPSCLRIPKEHLTKIPLKEDPETLARVLNKENFSVGAKIELAYKIAESGLFLLGTPWFSSLSSKNLLRNAGGQRHSFMLQIDTLDFGDLLSDDPAALAESSQLFKIGVLLAQIALDRSNISPWSEDCGGEIDKVPLLSEIERSMGAQYCKATAYCLKDRQPQQQFEGPEKYSAPHFAKWEEYLTDFLQDFHAQVFSREVTCQGHDRIANIS